MYVTYTRYMKFTILVTIDAVICMWTISKIYIQLDFSGSHAPRKKKEERKKKERKNERRKKEE